MALNDADADARSIEEPGGGARFRGFAQTTKRADTTQTGRQASAGNVLSRIALVSGDRSSAESGHATHKQSRPPVSWALRLNLTPHWLCKSLTRVHIA